MMRRAGFLRVTDGVPSSSLSGRAWPHFASPLLVVSVAAVYAAAVAWATGTFGIGVSPDSAHYIGAARSVVAGYGLHFNGAPFTHWPPLYPLVLAAVAQVTCMDALPAARLVAIAAAFINTLLAGALAGRLARGSRIAPIAATTLFALSPDVFRLHTMAWSEPLFLALAMGGLLWFRAPLGRGGIAPAAGDRMAPGAAAPCPDAAHARSISNSVLQSHIIVAATGLLCGLALLTRFVGVTLLASYAWLLCAQTGHSWNARAARLVSLLTPALIPALLWLAWLRLLTGPAAHDRPLAFHPPLPLKLPFVLLACISTLAFVWMAYRARRTGPAAEPELLVNWIVTFTAVYGAFVIASICLVDALTPIDARILSPVIVFGAIGVVGSLFARLGNERPGSVEATEKARWLCMPLLRIGGAALLFAAGSRLGGILPEAQALRRSGTGYTGQVWRSSPTLAFATALPPGALIYTNAPELIAFRSSRNAISLPERFSPTSLAPNLHLQEEMVQLTSAVAHGASVILFGAVPRDYVVGTRELEQYGLSVTARLHDGAVYGAPHRATDRPSIEQAAERLPGRAP